MRQSSQSQRTRSHSTSADAPSPARRSRASDVDAPSPSRHRPASTRRTDPELCSRFAVLCKSWIEEEPAADPAVAKRADPFVQWLLTAEEESDGED